jgi:hypothetical protein
MQYIMSKSLELLRKVLRDSIESGKISPTELNDRKVVTRSTTYAILRGRDTSLETLDKLADALEREPWQLIHPDGGGVVSKSDHEAQVAELVARIAEAEKQVESLRAALVSLQSGLSPAQRALIGAFADLLPMNEHQIHAARIAAQAAGSTGEDVLRTDPKLGRKRD